MSNPSQGYKLPESVPGAGESGLSGQNPNQSAFASGGRHPETLPEKMGATLGDNFSLGSTQAESKGEENLIPNPERNNPELTTAGRGGDMVRDELRSKDIDLPDNAPHMATGPNDSSRPLNSFAPGAKQA